MAKPEEECETLITITLADLRFYIEAELGRGITKEELSEFQQDFERGSDSIVGAMTNICHQLIFNKKYLKENKMETKQHKKHARTGLLILTRKPEQSVIINGNIEIKVLSVIGKQVRLGFTAPEEVTIHRKEVQDKIDAEM